LQLPSGIVQVLPLLQGIDISSLTSGLNELNSISFDVSLKNIDLFSENCLIVDRRWVQFPMLRLRFQLELST